MTETEKVYAKYKDKVAAAEKELRCNCDLDNWEPEAETGHSWVCRIHKAVMSGNLCQS